MSDPAGLLDAWAARVRANREQVDRFREQADGDFYAPMAERFRFDAARADDPLLPVLESLLLPSDVVLDIGAGGGRYALPLARGVRRVIAIDPSAAMLGVLRSGIAEQGADNVEIVEGRWPIEPLPAGDVAFIANVGHDVEDIGGFLDAMEGSSRRLCIAVMLELPPPFEIDALWPAVHGEPRAALPALPELLVLLAARGRRTAVTMVPRDSRPRDRDVLLLRARRMLWVREGSAKDRLLLAALDRGSGPVAQPRIGVVSWSPR